jgi:hypothetical protein
MNHRIYKINDIVWIQGVINPARVCGIIPSKMANIYEVEFTCLEETIIDEFEENQMIPYIARDELLRLALSQRPEILYALLDMQQSNEYERQQRQNQQRQNQQRQNQ